MRMHADDQLHNTSSKYSYTAIPKDDEFAGEIAGICAGSAE